MPMRKPAGPVAARRLPGRQMSLVLRTGLLGALLALTACTPRALYDTGRAWQRQTCTDIEDVQRRSACLDAASESYEQSQLTRR